MPMAMSPAMMRLAETASARALARIRVLNTSVVPTPARRREGGGVESLSRWFDAKAARCLHHQYAHASGPTPMEKRAMKTQMVKTMRPFSFSKGEAAAITRRQTAMPPVERRRSGRLGVWSVECGLHGQ